MNKLRPTKIAALSWAAVIAAVIAWMVAWGFYGSFPPIKPVSSVFLFLMAGVCVAAGVYVRRKINDEEIGMDRSQLSPVAVAQWMVFGQSVAWIGAILGGVYAGVGVHVALNAARLVAAQADIPGVVAGVIGGVAAAVGGAWLERCCVAPPMDPPLERAGAS